MRKIKWGVLGTADIARALLRGTNGDLKYYIANIKELTAQIIKMSNADEKALNEMRESSKKILETLTKERE